MQCASVPDFNLRSDPGAAISIPVSPESTRSSPAPCRWLWRFARPFVEIGLNHRAGIPLAHQSHSQKLACSHLGP
jgi:hypothetical protein